MTFIRTELKGDSLYLYPPKRLDSSNAPQTEAEIDAACAAHSGSKIVFDLEGMEYVSSAGLRVFLRQRKTLPDMRIINASAEVYDIFDMTGFTEIMPVEKAFRRISVEGCEIIGRGANGAVYRIDPETIVKVYMKADALAEIRNEQNLARRAFVLGIPTAISYDVVRVGDGYGSVFELLNAKSIAKLIQEEPENTDHYVSLYNSLLKTIHGTCVKEDEVPDMKQVALGWADFLRDYLPESASNRLIALIEAVPKDLHLLHGDYHIKNVMIQNGEALLIDMDTLCHGHPIFELASMYNAYCGFTEFEAEKGVNFLGISHALSAEIWRKSLCMYFDTDDSEFLDGINDKAKLLGYVRLMRRFIRRQGLETKEERHRIDMYREMILELLDRVDSLTF